MKTKLFSLSLLLLVALAGFSQQTEPDSRLLSRYDAGYLQQLKENSPRTLEILNYSLDNAWYVFTADSDKAEGLPELYFIDESTGKFGNLRVEKINPQNMNIYDFYFEQGYENRTFYRIGDSDMVLGFYSLKEMAEKFNKSKGLSHE